MEPAVSIVVLTYNQEQFIGQALDSIINQERSFPIEVLVNDDCSTDNTAAIVKGYQQKYPNIIKAYFQPVNKGAMNSFYNMLKLCRGKYFMNLAGDDYWLPDKIKLQFDYMESHPKIGMCFGKSRIVRDGKVVGNWGTKDGERFEALIFENKVSALTVCIRKSILDIYIKSIQPEQKDWKMEDWPIALWFSKHSKIHFFNKDLGVYRLVSGSLCHPKRINERLEFQDSRKEVCLFFAGDDKEFVRKIQIAHELAIANIFLAFDNLEEFRCHNLKGGMRGILKNFISYMPGGIYFLKRVIFN